MNEEYYFDSSALVKWYIIELGTRWVHSILAMAMNNIYIARITAVEVVAAMTLRMRTGSLTSQDAALSIAQFKEDFNREFIIVEITAPLIDSAVRLAERHGLRGYDAVQLASALNVQSNAKRLGRPAITFISADHSLNNAARAEGLVVDDPNMHG